MSKKLMPASTAAAMTSLVPSCVRVGVPGRPRLLQPMPTLGTTRPELPSLRYTGDSIRSMLLTLRCAGMLRGYFSSSWEAKSFLKRDVGSVVRSR